MIERLGGREEGIARWIRTAAAEGRLDTRKPGSWSTFSSFTPRQPAVSAGNPRNVRRRASSASSASWNVASRGARPAT